MLRQEAGCWCSLRFRSSGAEWVVVSLLSHPSPVRIGGSKHHQLQSDKQPDKTINLSKKQLLFAAFTLNRLQSTLHDRCECRFYPHDFIIAKL